MKNIERKVFIKELRRLGYKNIRQTGSHEIWGNGVHKISVPIHLNPCIAIRLAKEADMKNLLNKGE